jgi:DNA-binding transcriptional regulator YiaG
MRQAAEEAACRMQRLSTLMLVWRAQFRLNQQAAADLCNVSLRTWQRWEREHTRPGEDEFNTVMWVISQPPPWWDRTGDDA